MSDINSMKVMRHLISSSINLKGVRHFEPSVICSPEAEEVGVSNKFFQLLMSAFQYAQRNEIFSINSELPDSIFYNVFPGEHYRLLKGMVSATRATKVVEIGTFTGMGSFALMQGFEGRPGNLTTYDLVPLREFKSHLTDAFVTSNHFEQRIVDLAVKESFEQELDRLSSADIIFLDGPKDGKFEYTLLQHLTRLRGTDSRMLVIDDIRFLNMTALWRSIKSEKFDCTSFGHWSGTGVVDISDGLVLY